MVKYMDEWDPKLRGLHEAFSTWLILSSKAKVWVIVGKHNRVKYQKQFSKTFALLMCILVIYEYR